jgi:two-component system C4-dicarboxylate transport response regulator DctD
MTPEWNVLFVEDDPAVRTNVAESLELAGLKVRALDNAEDALALAREGLHAVVVTDVLLPGMDGVAFFRRLRKLDAGLPVILVTGHGDISMAVQAMREGAYDFMEKPFSTERLAEACTRALEKRGLQLEVEALRRQVAGRRTLEETLLGRSEAMRRLRQQVANLGSTNADVLIWGETGTGKELVASCLHALRAGGEGPFVAINCAGLPENLFESEVFGHEAGAFTGAAKRRIGKMEHASGGTLFLDEIESMPLAQQAKLLRALQERRIERLGSNTSIPVDVRVIAATKSDLKALSDAGTFRGDLYYRLGVVVLELPALRERREDIPLLLDHFLLAAAARYGRPVPQVQPDVLRALMAADWPGNVRELRNAADRIVLGLAPELAAAGERPTLPQQVDLFEKALIEQALKEHAGRPQAVCDALGIARKTLYDKLHRHGIAIDSFRD